jgi:hypothetical protein
MPGRAALFDRAAQRDAGVFGESSLARCAERYIVISLASSIFVF